MAYPTRIKYTDEMRSYIWDRYQQGDAVKAIARSFDRHPLQYMGTCLEQEAFGLVSGNDLHRHSALQSERKYREALYLVAYKKNKRPFLGHFTLSNRSTAVNCRS